MATEEKVMLPLILESLPAYVQVVVDDRWGFEFCRDHLFLMVKQKVEGEVLPVSIGEVQKRGLPIKPDQLTHHHRRVVEIKPSTEMFCRICDWRTLYATTPDLDLTPVPCYNPCCSGH